MNELLRKLLCLPEQGSTVASEIDAFHYVVIGVTMLGAATIATLAIVFVSLWKSHSDETLPLTPRVRVPLWLETGLVGGTLLLFVSWWVYGFRQFQRTQTPPANASAVWVTGKQWVWDFRYPDGRTSQHALYVPANRPVKLLLTSRDVVHSFFVPAFRLKKDVVPGRYTVLWFEAKPGTYDIYCAEYCGTAHSRMRGTVVVLAPDEWDRWQRGGPAREAQDDGIRVAARQGCLQCHSLDGARGVGPTFKDLLGAHETLDTGERVLVDGAYVTRSMMEPRAQLVAGFAPVMPSYQGRITPEETAAIVELLRSLSRAPRAAVPGEEATRARRD